MTEYLASEHWRRRCEAFALIRLYSTGEGRQLYIDRVAKKRGEAAAKMLRDDLRAELHARRNGGMVPPYPRGV